MNPSFVAVITHMEPFKPFIFPWVLDGFLGSKGWAIEPKIDPKVPRVQGVGGAVVILWDFGEKMARQVFFFSKWENRRVVFGSRNGMGINPCIAGILPSTVSVVGYGEKKLRANHGI